MPTLRERALDLIRAKPGLTDRGITDRLSGRAAPPQAINATCRSLSMEGLIERRPRAHRRIGNFLSVALPATEHRQPQPPSAQDPLSEDRIKHSLKVWLESSGWKVDVAWAKQHGVDIEAHRNRERWIIEVKGRGSRQAMRVNYFLGVLGELLERMGDPTARYSIALPSLPQFQKLWERLPAHAKARTRISALFVDEGGKVEER